jgi:hypothetical protein
MRLWSLHPRLLDRRALVALWREGLLAQAVMRGRTKGYRHHPQLERFSNCDSPLPTLVAYLEGVRAEATRRGYSFDKSRLARTRGTASRITVSRSQMELEWKHLLAKVRARDPEWLRTLRGQKPSAHPSFRLVSGPVASWERATAPAS